MLQLVFSLNPGVVPAPLSSSWDPTLLSECLQKLASKAFLFHFHCLFVFLFKCLLFCSLVDNGMVSYLDSSLSLYQILGNFGLFYLKATDGTNTNLYCALYALLKVHSTTLDLMCRVHCLKWIYTALPSPLYVDLPPTQLFASYKCYPCRRHHHHPHHQGHHHHHQCHCPQYHYHQKLF